MEIDAVRVTPLINGKVQSSVDFKDAVGTEMTQAGGLMVVGVLEEGGQKKPYPIKVYGPGCWYSFELLGARPDKGHLLTVPKPTILVPGGKMDA
jgi:hypothetical protein